MRVAEYFRVSAARLTDAARARRSVRIAAAAMIALAAAAWVIFPPGDGTRITLTLASALLAFVAVGLILRVRRIQRKSERFLGAEGEFLAISPETVTVGGGTIIPADAISGVWAADRGAELRERTRRTIFGLPGRTMLRAGVNTADVTIGISDAERVIDGAALLTRFRAHPGGERPARIEIPFGSFLDSSELQRALRAARSCLPADVPVRLTDGVMDYSTAWAGTADPVDVIRARERQRRD